MTETYKEPFSGDDVLDDLDVGTGSPVELPVQDVDRGIYERAFRRLTRDPLSILGIIMLLIILVVAIIAPFLSPHDPIKLDIDSRFIPPRPGNLFGTDHIGRDVFTRVVYGARLSLLVAVVVSGISAFLGLLIGGTAGYVGGRVDEAIMRITDVFQSFPWLLFAMAVSLVIGPNLWNGMLALSFIWWPGYARLVRGQVLATKSKEFVQAAQAIGARNLRIFFQHVVPNSMGPYIVMLTVGAGRVILATSTLSFVGLGAQPPTPEWGVMISDGRLVLFDAWWIATFPGLALLFTAIAFNLIGDGLRDLLDPTSQVQ